MEVKYDLIGGLSMKRIVIVGILVIWLILLAMWFLQQDHQLKLYCAG